MLERLLDTYRKLGVVTAVPLALDVSQPMAAVAFVQVHWELKGQDDRTIYDFAAVYSAGADRRSAANRLHRTR